MTKKQGVSMVDLLLVFVAASWGLHPIFIKFGIENLDPGTFGPLRMVLAAITAIAITGFLKEFKTIDKCDYPKLFIVSITGYFCYQYFFGLGSMNTTSGNVSFIFALVPVSIAIINWVRKTETITKQMLAGILVSVLGVFTLILGSGQSLDFSGSNMKGIIYVFMAQLAFALFTTLSGDLSKKYSSSLVSCYAITISSILFVGFSAKDINIQALVNAPAIAWINAALSGVLAVSVSSFLWTWGARKLGSTKVSVYNNLPPVFTMIAGYFMLGETFTITQITGALLIFGGLYITNAKFNFNKLSYANNI